MRDVTGYSYEELLSLQQELERKYDKFQSLGLKLDMSRGKPSSSQLDLCNGALDKLNTYFTFDGVDARNYGILDGIPEVRDYFGKLLAIDPAKIIIGGNSSLNLMYDLMVQLVIKGTSGNTPWGKLDEVKFLCPAPGYDRHFAICESLGIKMITVDMTENGPDMEQVESLVSADASIKGIWCVPLYSNPQGICYSDETVRRLGKMKCAANDFRIFWDNAYGIHHLKEKTSLADIFSACEAGGNPDRPYYFFSTSKITFPGAGVALLATSLSNRKEIIDRMKNQTIGYDKLNQLRLLQFLPTPEDMIAHMAKLGDAISPKFEVVLSFLEKEFAGSGLLSWTTPKGGYFISVDTLDGCAAETVRLAAEAGVKLTGAGATFPYHRDPRDRNIRLAPTYPCCEELTKAMELFVICAKLAGVRKLVAAKKA